MDLRGLVEVTEVDQRELAKAAYAMSRPQGMGFLHFTEGELDQATLNAIIEQADKFRGGCIDLDYVRGRSCKFHVRLHDGKRYVSINWYDHSVEEMSQLLRDCKVPDVEARIAKAIKGNTERQLEYDEENRRERVSR
jgi:hypothetical protein